MRRRKCFNLFLYFQIMNIDHLDVVFVQHKMHVTEDTKAYFIENGLVAIHYVHDLIKGRDELSTNPDDYNTKAARVLRRMQKYCKSGALAVGYYAGKENRMIIGFIPPNTKIESKYFDIWKNDEYPDGETSYKFVRLQNYFEVDLSQNRQLESCMPRGNVFIKWRVNNVDRTIRHLYKVHHGLINKRDINVFDLSYSDLEVLCSEYLRTITEDIRIDHFITPIGRSKKSTDIDGINDSGNVLAQVSFSQNNDKISRKMNNLLKYNHENTYLVYFGPKSKEELNIKPIRFIPIEEVFDYMKKNTILLESLLPIY